jgi:hypothetical protein
MITIEGHPKLYKKGCPYKIYIPNATTRHALFDNF